MGLVVSRKAGEQILIGDDISVTVVRIKDAKVRLDISAPADVSIDRREVRVARDSPADPDKADARPEGWRVRNGKDTPDVPEVPEDVSE